MKFSKYQKSEPDHNCSLIKVDSDIIQYLTQNADLKSNSKNSIVSSGNDIRDGVTYHLWVAISGQNILWACLTVKLPSPFVEAEPETSI